MSEFPAERRWFRFSLRTLFVVVMVAACAAYLYTFLPNELTSAELSSIKRGMTESEVIELVGRPDAMTFGENGKTTWTYGFIPDWVEFKDGRVVEAVQF